MLYVPQNSIIVVLNVEFISDIYLFNERVS